MYSKIDMKYITIHSSATQNSPIYTRDKIKEWHLDRGFRDIGYNFVIETSGEIKVGRPLSRTGAHVKGHNTANIGICLIGGVNFHGDPEMNYTEDQLQSLYGLVKGLQAVYSIPDKNVRGHRDWSPDLNKDGVISKNEWVKVCPCFDVEHWMETGEAVFEVV